MSKLKTKTKLAATAPDPPHTIRIRTSTFGRLRALVEEIRQRGWGSVVASRDDQISLGNVIDQGLVMLEAKLKGSKR